MVGRWRARINAIVYKQYLYGEDQCAETSLLIGCYVSSFFLSLLFF
jgi:hypothetical protein